MTYRIACHPNMTDDQLKASIWHMQWEDETSVTSQNVETLEMGKKVWIRTPFKRPHWVLDRMVPATITPGAAPKTRLLMITGTVTRDDQPGVSFDAAHLRWLAGRWQKRGDTITNAARIGAIWDQRPTLLSWVEMRKRIRLAAQMGQWINPPLPEDL